MINLSSNPNNPETTDVVKVKVAVVRPALCDPMNYTVHGILQARILEWVAFPFFRGSLPPRDWTQVSHITGRFFISWATRETFLRLLCVCVCVRVCVCVCSENCSLMSNSLWPHELYSPWNSPGQNTGVGSLSFLRGIFPRCYGTFLFWALLFSS